MSDGFGDLLRITPRCEAARCRRNGTVRLSMLKDGWTKVQRTVVCPTHAPIIAKAAEAQGITVTIS